MPALVDRLSRLRLKKPRAVVLLGVDLADAREEAFVRMVVDGLAVGMAYAKAGFTSKAKDAPLNLFHKPHIQERAAAILEARRTQGVVTLPEVTDMLKRVFAGALHDAEYSAAHNAAFSLARLYGHVTDRAVLEVRRPSREPDAPSEMALASWVESLPALPGPAPAALGLGPAPEGAPDVVAPASPASPASPAEAGPNPRLSSAPAAPLRLQPGANRDLFSDINGLDGLDDITPSPGPGPGPRARSEFFNEINWLREGPGPTRGRPENGAPSRPVTGTPPTGGRSDLLGDEGTTPPGGSEKGAPLQNGQVPAYPSAEELFG